MYTHLHRVTFVATDLHDAVTCVEAVQSQLWADVGLDGSVTVSREPRVSIDSIVTYSDGADLTGTVQPGYDVEITWETQS